jgi:hypothetical protein
VARNHTPAGIAVVSLYHITNTVHVCTSFICRKTGKIGLEAERKAEGRKGFWTLNSDMREYRKHK